MLHFLECVQLCRPFIQLVAAYIMEQGCQLVAALSVEHIKNLMFACKCGAFYVFIGRVISVEYITLDYSMVASMREEKISCNQLIGRSINCGDKKQVA